MDSEFKFANTYCSQCGAEFGPGDHGFSSCKEHRVKRGGAGRGQGRPPVKAGEETVTVSLRLTETQRDKLKRLGGAGFVRKQIDRAKEPNADVTGLAPREDNK